MKKIFLRSASDTKRLAAGVAKNILRSRSGQGEGAAVIALIGELGSGKTTFVQGLAKALGVRGRVVSPTFLMARAYMLPASKSPFSTLYHIDLFRTRSDRELSAIGFKEIMRNSGNIVAIEWAEKAKRFLPNGALRLIFHHGRRENERIVEVRGNAW